MSKVGYTSLQTLLEGLLVVLATIPSDINVNKKRVPYEVTDANMVCPRIFLTPCACASELYCRITSNFISHITFS